MAKNFRRAWKYPAATMKQTWLVGVLKPSTVLFKTKGKEKNRLRSALLKFGGDSKASRSWPLRIFILGIVAPHGMGKAQGFVML